jgi:hypothetical protein
MSPSDTFAGFICWNPNELSQVLDYEAGRLADSVLLAAHSPATVTIGENGERITEQEALDRLIHIDEGGIKIVPILGKAGSGKSHLVRWFKPQVEQVEDAFVVYVPKGGENLRGLVLGVLDRLDEVGEMDESRELREQLETAFSRIAEDGIEEAILNQISLQLHQISTRESEDGRRQGIAQLLRPLLLAEEFRVPLRAEGGVVDRYRASVEEETGDLQAEGFRFGVEDIPRAADLRGRLGDAAQESYDQVTSDPEYLEIAAELISDAFHASIPQLFGLVGQTSLEDVFGAARKLLLGKGKELYVLIEDLSRMQGFEDALLEAFLVLPTPQGQPQQLCNLHVAIAVTDGFYNTYTSPTFRSRVAAMNGTDGGRLLYLESIPDSDGWDSTTLTSFTSRYLNALRVGPKDLERAYVNALADGSAADPDAWVPQSCSDCPHMDSCHSSFGATNGQGHYPFNEHSLNAFYLDVVRRPEVSDRLEEQFNPRYFIQFVLDRLLRESPDHIRDGTFPNSELEHDYRLANPLKPGVIVSLSNLEDKDRQRRQTLLRYWANPDELPAEQAIDLASGIHEAFAISRIGVDRLPEIRGTYSATGTSISLSWKVPPGATEGIDLKYAKNGVDWESLLTGSNELSFEHEDRTENIRHCYEVVASGSPTDLIQRWTCEVIVGAKPLLPIKIDPLVGSIAEWHGGQPLGSGETNKINKSLYDAIEATVDWHGLGLPPPPSAGNETHLMGRQGPGVVFNRFSLHVEDSIGVVEADTKVIRKITRENPPGLLIHLSEAMTSRKKTGAIGLGVGGYSTVTGFIDGVADEVSKELLTSVETDESLTRALAERLAISGVLGGAGESRLDHVALAEAAFAEETADTGGEAGPWAQLVDVLPCESGKRTNFQKRLADLARTTQAAYNDGSTVRAGRVARLLESLATEWTPLKEHAGPPRIDLLTSRSIKTAVEERVNAFEDAINSLGTLLGSETADWETIINKVNGAFTAALQADFNVETPGINELYAALRRQPAPEEYQGLKTLAEDEDRSIGEKIQLIGTLERLRPLEVAKSLRSVSDLLDQTIENGRQVLGIRPDDDGSDDDGSDDDGSDDDDPIDSLAQSTLSLKAALDQL